MRGSSAGAPLGTLRAASTAGGTLMASRRKTADAERIRYAVVGLGYIAQAAVLPAFKNAENSELTAFVSDDPKKLRALGEKYGVEERYSYAELDRCLESGTVDAVYIALPNNMH